MEQKESKKSLTREELRKAQKNKAKQQEEIAASEEQERPEKLKWRIRLIPIWLRILILLAAMAVAVVAGAMVGYGVLGGGNPLDVLEKETWQHIFDLVNKE
ncbi:DNA-directed RNA polymerase subunit beta [Sutcliffiella horikoshii]|uniref:DNA-directed RNA polymerase subunit beta n=1 Tax=Sutcliffiella horikoshii TaxID=79883 RepID=A0A5D4T711_9BACI|nr:DNA-directed RNA polymerase subunit beta [Sutcliffiella horikoshii]TYS70016.1 DNA-directed RNA polymerase subunit beta [Sutcliffiella horikoshii]